jgi:hypothetical protein
MKVDPLLNCHTVKMYGGEGYMCSKDYKTFVVVIAIKN